MKTTVSMVINGREQQHLVADGALLIDFLREQLGLTGTKQGCDGGECGACTVLIDGKPRLSCVTLTKTVAGKPIETVESLAQKGRISRLQAMFHEKLGTQCGFCTPGMIMAAEGLLRSTPNPDVAQIKTALSGNLCRCTGYVKIIESVQAAAQTEGGAG
jgi:4-hydroxybenzoyl-CoA reductase subunit gamma